MLALLALLALILLTLYRLLRPSRLPPSPPGLPFLGHALQLPTKGLFLVLDAWRTSLGDVFSLNAAGQRIVVLASARSAADVLDRMSAVTVDRPRFIMMNDIMAGGFPLTSIPGNDRWKRMRRIVHSGFSPRAVCAYARMQEAESASLCRYLLSHPTADLYAACERAAGSAVLRALYGGPSLFAEAAAAAEATVGALNVVMDGFMRAAMPLAYAVETVPALRHLPAWAAPWKRYGEAFFRDTDAFLRSLYEEGCQNKAAGGKAKGFSAASEEARTAFGITPQEAAWTAGTLFAAGTETTAAVTQSFCLAMLLYPDVQKEAQAEIDAVLGPNAPTLADRERLPYIQAVVKETLRWRPPLAAGFAHLSTEEFTYNEYVIPKDTIIMGSIWSMNHDRSCIPDHAAFRPSRFLTPAGTLTPPLPNYHDDDLAYGHGRRICPGRHFANNMLFVEIAYLLWAFELAKARGEDGAEITPPDMEFVDKGLTCHSASFPCVFRPRQPNLMDVLTQI